jgi:hypothetical protein
MKIRTGIKRTPFLGTALSLLCIAMLWFGCKKAAEPVEPIQATDVSIIAIVKSWLAEKKISANAIQQQGIDSLLTKAAWEQSMQTGVSSEKLAIYVPIRNSETVGLEFFYDTRNRNIDSGNIVRIKTKDNIPNAQIFAVQTYYQSVLLKRPLSKGFTGTIEAYSINNTFLYNYTYSEGKILSHGIAAPKQKKQTISKDGAAIRKDTYGCETWALWVLWPDGTVTLDHTWEICPPGFGCVPPSLAVMLGSGQQYIKINCEGDNGGGGGGAPNSGGVTLEQILAAFDDQIDDQLVNDCLKQVLAKLKAIKSGKFGEIINKFSNGDIPNWTWEIKEGTVPSDQNANTRYTYGKATTTLDYDKLKNATNMSTARTMVHESIHAYLSVFFINDPGTAAKTYPEMVKAWNRAKHPDYNQVQHDQMERSFVDDIAAVLKEFGTSLGLQMDDLDYKDMAWGGLDFLNNTSLTDDDKDRIGHRLLAEQTNARSGTTYPIGTKTCN